jgi:hypothetical protein
MPIKKSDAFFPYFLILSYLIDPKNTVFHFRIPAFLLFIIWCLVTKKKMNFEGVMIFCLYYLLLFLATFNMYINDYVFVPGDTITYFISPLYLLVLVFISDESVNIFYPCLMSARIISVMTIGISVLVIFFPLTVAFLEEIVIVKEMFRISDSIVIMGHSFIRVFHISSPTVVISLGYSLSLFINKKNIYFFFECLLFIAALLFSGTRANMLSCLLVLVLIICYHVFINRKNMLLFVFFFVIIAFFSLLLVFLLFRDNTNASSAVKYGHISSLNDIFENNINILFFGNGPGSLYYTSGFNDITTRSELSYYELVRIFGVFSALIICMIYFYPLFIISFNIKKNIYSFSFCISYLAYLFIAGTNPLLIVPQGFTMLLLAYSFANNFQNVYLKSL